MNLKAWDNKGATCRLPFRLLLVLTVCGGLWTGATGGSGVLPHASACAPAAVCLRGAPWLERPRRVWTRNEGGLFGGERTTA